ncbi:iron transporter [Gleimia hominis]|uniref:Iron transporter n=1 Tax=Gleimia hominis TaxID=595468 RepID=A0ABU3IA28_9ACTO|nr:iron transporter [Gleimia hominis]MDT3767229.1 iron transporter [Gleimia hominis]
MNTIFKRALAIGSAVALAGTLAACSPQAKDDKADAGKDTAASQSQDENKGDDQKEDGGDDDAGFREEPVGDDVIVKPIKVSAVYFQPVPMTPENAGGTPAKEASIHLEADISAMPDNDLGYGAGDFIPGLGVDYEILDQSSNKEVLSGTLMPMNASDGPHYGLNLPKLDAGTYKLRIKVKSPEKASSWMLHTDPETGVKGRFWGEDLVAEFDNWNYDPADAWW